MSISMRVRRNKFIAQVTDVLKLCARACTIFGVLKTTVFNWDDDLMYEDVLLKTDGRHEMIIRNICLEVVVTSADTTMGPGERFSRNPRRAVREMMHRGCGELVLLFSLMFRLRIPETT